MTVVAGIDLGTTSVRVGLFDSSGSIRATAQAPLPVSFPRPGWVEQDPDVLVALPLDLLRRTLHEADLVAADVDGVGIACQRGTIVAWDAATGRAITAAIGWQDRRTQPRVDALRAEGISVNTMASCTKIEWLLHEHPESRDAHHRGDLRIGTVDSWLTWKLTAGGAFITDPSNAGATGLYSPRSRSWSESALDLFHIDAAVLPEVTDTASVAGMMRLEVGGHTIPVAARVGDQQAACFAHGVREGQAKLTLGTSAMLDVGLGADWPKPPAGAHLLPLWRLTEGHKTVEPSCVEGSIAAAGASVEWLVRLGLLTAVTELDHAATRGRSGVTVVPALAGLGTPHDHNAARGVVIGLALDTEPADIALGVVEGIAQRGAEVAEALGIDSPLPVDGGLSRSTVLLQRLADATGQPVLPALDPETALRGAAMLAAVTTDYHGALGEVELGDPVLPACSLDERQGRRARFAAAVEATLQNVDN